MRGSVQVTALAVVILGGSALAGAPRKAAARVFDCGFAECITTTTCPDMQQFCLLHNCNTDLYNCGELFNCSGEKRLHWCSSAPPDQ